MELQLLWERRVLWLDVGALEQRVKAHQVPTACWVLPSSWRHHPPPASSTSFPLGHRQGPSANTSVIFNEEQGRGRSCLQQVWKVQLTKGRRET